MRAVVVALQPQLLVHVFLGQVERCQGVRRVHRLQAVLAGEELGVGVVPLVHLTCGRGWQEGLRVGEGRAGGQASAQGLPPGTAWPGVPCSPLTTRLPLVDTSKVWEASRSRTSRSTVPVGSRVTVSPSGQHAPAGPRPPCLTRLRQDGSLVQRHVLEHHGHLLHVLVQDTCQGPPDQAQVASGRKQGAATDAVVHQVVVGGLGADVCVGTGLSASPGGGGWVLSPAAPAPARPAHRWCRW